MEIMAITFYYNKIKIQIFKIFSGTIEETVQMHSHSKGGYEIHLIDYGHGTLDTADESYIITPNTLYVTGPNVLHKQTPDSNSPMHELCVFFKIPNQTYNNEAITAFASNTFWIGESSDEIQDLFSQMIKENENGGLYKDDVLSSLAIRLICEISKLYCPNKEKRTTDLESSDLNENRSWILDQLLLDDCSNVRLDDFAKKNGSQSKAGRKNYKGLL